MGKYSERYDGVHGGYGFAERTADGQRLLEFYDAVELVHLID